MAGPIQQDGPQLAAEDAPRPLLSGREPAPRARGGGIQLPPIIVRPWPDDEKPEAAQTRPGTPGADGLPSPALPEASATEIAPSEPLPDPMDPEIAPPEPPPVAPPELPPAPQRDPSPEQSASSDSGGITLKERTRLHGVNAFTRGTIAGAAYLYYLRKVSDSPESDGLTPDQKAFRAARRAEYDEIVADLKRYDDMPGASTFAEYAAAVAGDLAGGSLSPEGMLGPVARGASMTARAISGALRSGAFAAATDSVVQVLNIQAGVQDKYDLSRTAGASVLGSATGTVSGALSGRGTASHMASSSAAGRPRPSSRGAGHPPSSSNGAGHPPPSNAPAPPPMKPRPEPEAPPPAAPAKPPKKRRRVKRHRRKRRRGRRYRAEQALVSRRRASHAPAQDVHVAFEVKEAMRRGVIRDVKIITAEEANKPFIAKGDKPPYAAGTLVYTFVTNKVLTFTRFTSDKGPGQWMVKAGEVAGMTADQARIHLALKQLPTDKLRVNVPKGTRMQTGIVGAQPQWGAPNDGGIQYQLLQDIPDESFGEFRKIQ